MICDIKSHEWTHCVRISGVAVFARKIIMTSTVHVVRSKRDAPAIIVENYKYTRSKTLKSNCDVIWMCPKKTCYASIKTNDKTVILETRGAHNHHGLSSYDVEKLKIDNVLKRKATEQPTVRPSKLIRKAIEASENDVTKNDITNWRRHIYRKRRKVQPAAAGHVTRLLAAEQTEILTSARERFVFVEEDVEDGDRRHPVVAVTCESNLRMLCGFLPLYADAVPDRCCPEHFGRAYVVHAYKHGLYVPLVYLLTDGGGGRGADAAAACYAAAWRFLVRLCRWHGLMFMPGSVHADLDRDERAAVRAVFPGCTVLTCRFHLGRVWRAHLDRCYPQLGPLCDGGGAAAADTTETGRWLRLFAGLSFLPPAEVPDAFCELIEIAPDDMDAIRFSDHVLENYVEHGSPDPPHTWAKAPTADDSTSTAVGPDAFHRHYARQFSGTAAPPVWKVINVLRKIQAQTYVKIDKILHSAEWHGAGHCSEETKRIRFVNECYSKYVGGEMSRLQFVKMMACTFDGLPRAALE